MQSLFFLGIISVEKEKIQNKNSTKTKTIEVSHFAVETAGQASGWAERGWGQGDHKPPARAEPRGAGAGLGPKLQPVVKKEKGFRGFLQLRTQKKQK